MKINKLGHMQEVFESGYDSIFAVYGMASLQLESERYSLWTTIVLVTTAVMDWHPVGC